MGEREATCPACGAPSAALTEKMRRSELAAAAPSTTAPASERIGWGRVGIAAAGLLVLGGVLAVLASVVHDDAVASSRYHVEPGKISVIGTSRLRSWSGDTFSLVIPVTWKNTENGQVAFDNTKKRAPIGKFVWEAPAGAGTLTVFVGDEFYTLNQRGRHDLPSPREAAVLDSETTLHKHRRLVRPGDDIGPIGGAIPAWRWLHTDVPRSGPATRNDDLYFTTCREGTRAQAWTVQTSAPADAYDEGTFESIVRSLKTELQPSSVDGKCPK